MLKKFNLVTIASMEKTQGVFRKQMPVFQPHFKDWQRPMWSVEDTGAWVIFPVYNDTDVLALDIYFYENTGVVHLLSNKFDYNYFEMYKAIKTQTSVPMLDPIEYCEFDIDLAHPLIDMFQRKQLSYIKFTPPFEGFSKPAHTDLILNPQRTSNWITITQYIEYVDIILTKLKQLKYRFPNNFSIEQLFVNDRRYYIGVIPYNNLDINTAVDKYIKKLETDLTSIHEFSNGREKIITKHAIEKAELKWKPLMI